MRRLCDGCTFPWTADRPAVVHVIVASKRALQRVLANRWEYNPTSPRHRLLGSTPCPHVFASAGELDLGRNCPCEKYLAESLATTVDNVFATDVKRWLVEVLGIPRLRKTAQTRSMRRHEAMARRRSRLTGQMVKNVRPRKHAETLWRCLRRKRRVDFRGGLTRACTGP